MESHASPRLVSFLWRGSATVSTAFALTVRADAGKVQSKPNDVVTGKTLNLPLDEILRQAVSIVHPPAVDAPHMVVLLRVTIEPGLCPAYIELLNHAVLRQQLKVPINSAQA